MANPFINYDNGLVILIEKMHLFAILSIITIVANFYFMILFKKIKK